MNSRTTVLMTLLVISSGCLLMTLGVADTSAAGDESLTFYTYSPTFNSTAEGAENVCWDFGDGTILDSRDSGPDYIELLLAHGGDVHHPTHTYENVGDYIVTLTAFNPLGEHAISYTVHIMGHPIVTFRIGGTTITAEVPFVGKDPQILPENKVPIIDDNTFEGWYYDSNYTEKWSPDDLIDGHKTLYAKMSQSSDTPLSIYIPIVSLVLLVLLALGIWAVRKGNG